jgi:hypothetical protein
MSNTGSVGNRYVLVRHEKRLLPGLLLVRNVYAGSDLGEATLTVVGPLSVEVRTVGTPRRLDFLPFVYF